MLSTALLLPAAAAAAAPPFAEEGARALPGVTTTCGESTAEKPTIIEVNGGGVLLADLDVDGDQDLFLVDGSTLGRGPFRADTAAGRATGGTD